jgi:hypothetical protein
MKRNLKILFITALLFIAPLFMFGQNPPLPGDDPVDGQEVPSAGAPVGNGTFILITLAVAYAVRKVYEIRSTSEAE